MFVIVFILLMLLAVGMPIGLSLLGASSVYMYFDPLLSLRVIPRSFFNILNSYTLLTAFFFVFAGFIMERTGLVRQLFRFAEALLSWLPGGFGVATVITCVLFGAVSGSSVAGASAMSLIAVPEMKKRDYPDWLSAGIVAAGGGIGLLIPPSLALILFGIITETSVIDLFSAGIIPGLMMAAAMIIIIVITGWRLNLSRGVFSFKAVLSSARAAIWGLGMPAVVLGGLYGGLFTPTEAGAAACLYAIVYGLASRRGEFLKEIIPVTVQAASLSGVIYFIIGAVGVFQFVASNKAWPQQMTAAITNWDLTAVPFLFAFLLVLIVLGMFLDGVSMLLITVPIVFPIATSLGVHPIHLGILATMAVELGVLTPPVGFNLYAVSSVAKIPIQTVLRGTAIFFLSHLAVTVILILFPWLSTWLPSIMVKPGLL